MSLSAGVIEREEALWNFIFKWTLGMLMNSIVSLRSNVSLPETALFRPYRQLARLWNDCSWAQSLRVSACTRTRTRTRAALGKVPSHIPTLIFVTPIYLFPSVGEGNGHSKENHGRVFSHRLPLLSLMCNTYGCWYSLPSNLPVAFWENAMNHYLDCLNDKHGCACSWPPQAQLSWHPCMDV